jgi:8-oxo-dGTP pyrophosphatase MutT (NUDIX family)
MKERNMNTPASYLVLMRNNQVLLLQRANTWYHDGDYSVIAGHVEQDETFTDAIIREAKEESGIILDRSKIKVAHIQHRKSDKDGWGRVHVYFIATEREWDIKNLENEKCSDLSWFDIDKLPKNMVDCVKFSIENIRNGVFYSEFWR